MSPYSSQEWQPRDNSKDVCEPTRTSVAQTWTHDGCKLAFGEGSVNRQLARTETRAIRTLMREGCADSRRKRDCLARGASIISKGVFVPGSTKSRFEWSMKFPQVRQRAAVDFDGAITSLLSGAMALCDGGDHVAARGAEVSAASLMVVLSLMAYATHTMHPIGSSNANSR